MQYSEEIIEEVIARNNIVDVIGEHVALKRRGANYFGLCPFHNEKTGSFSVSEQKQMYYCFGCHAGGNVITFVMEYNHFTFVEALRYLAERAGMTLPEEALSPARRAEAEKRKQQLAALKQAAGFYYYRLHTEAGAPGLAYLRKRGLTDETIRHFGLGYADKYGSTLYRYLKQKGYSDEILRGTGLFEFDEKRGVSDRFWNRVMFPILDERGRVIGFGGRVLGDGKPKYLNSPESSVFNKRMHLYALNYARSSRKGYLILCEGYMDVITMHQAGFTNACASLGTALTAEQAGLVRRFAGEVRLLYDSDGAGIGAALRAIPILKEAGIASRVVSLRPHKDPDEFLRAEGAEKFEERLDAAENAFLFEADQLASGVRRDDPAAWTEFERKLADRLTAISEPLERRNYTEAAAARFSIPQDELEDLVRRRAAMGTPAETFRKPRSLRRPDEKEDADVTAQKLMLAYLAAYPEAYQETKDLIDASDFTDPLCSALSKALYAQLEEGGPAEARLVAMFDDPEEQSRAAALFHTSIPVQSAAELDRAFTDTVRRMIRSGSEAAMRQAAGQNMAALSRFIARKKILEQFDRGKLLSLHDPRFENEKRR